MGRIPSIEDSDKKILEQILNDLNEQNKKRKNVWDIEENEDNDEDGNKVKADSELEIKTLDYSLEMVFEDDGPVIIRLKDGYIISLSFEGHIPEDISVIDGLSHLTSIYFHVIDNKNLIPKIFTLNCLERIQYFGMNQGDLEQIPDEIDRFKNLVYLCLSNNRLTEISPSLLKLEKLKALNLSGNRLRDLPHFFSELKFLRELNLDENFFMRFPSVLLEMLDMEKITWYNNPFPKFITKFLHKHNFLHENIEHPQMIDDLIFFTQFNLKYRRYVSKYEKLQKKQALLSDELELWNRLIHKFKEKYAMPPIYQQRYRTWLRTDMIPEIYQGCPNWEFCDDLLD